MGCPDGPDVRHDHVSVSAAQKATKSVRLHARARRMRRTSCRTCCWGPASTARAAARRGAQWPPQPLLRSRGGHRPPAGARCCRSRGPQGEPQVHWGVLLGKRVMQPRRGAQAHSGSVCRPGGRWGAAALQHRPRLPLPAQGHQLEGHPSMCRTGHTPPLAVPSGLAARRPGVASANPARRRSIAGPCPHVRSPPAANQWRRRHGPGQQGLTSRPH